MATLSLYGPLKRGNFCRDAPELSILSCVYRSAVHACPRRRQARHPTYL